MFSVDVVCVHLKFNSFPDESVHVSGFSRTEFCTLWFNNVFMVNAVFRYCCFAGLCPSYMSIVLFDSSWMDRPLYPI